MSNEVLKSPRQTLHERIRGRAIDRALKHRDKINAKYAPDFRNCPELKDVADNEFPEVVEITPDAQRRFGEEFGISMIEAYQEGTNNLVNLIDASCNLPIKTLIAWAFSSDNWGRPAEQVDGLLKLMLKNYPTLEKHILKNNARFTLFGRREIREEKAAQFEAYVPFHTKLLELEEKTKENTGKNVVVAFDFSGEDQRMRSHDAMYILGHKEEKAGIKLKENEPEDIKRARMLSVQDGEGRIGPAHLGVRTGEEIKEIDGFILAHISDVGPINSAPTFWALFQKQFPLLTLQDLARAIRKYVIKEKRHGK